MSAPDTLHGGAAACTDVPFEAPSPGTKTGTESAGLLLRDHTTLGIGGPARRFEQATSEDEIIALCREARDAHEPLLILGGGSNLVVADEGIDALVIAVAMRGITLRRGVDQGDGVHVELDVAAGEPWDDLVARSTHEGLAGLECLSGIPGLVGATPIQNVGAYGQEVGDRIVAVHVYDRHLDTRRSIPAASCRFGYRDSLFKSVEPDRHVVLGVTFRLRAGMPDEPRYGELREALRADGDRWRETSAQGRASGHVILRETVITLRRRKGMVLDPGDPDSRSAGSFFMNPTVPTAVANEVEQRARALGVLDANARMPAFPAANGMTKLAAGWLIERSGFHRGLSRGRVGISTRHALALVNLGDATAAELMALAHEIQGGVHRTFGVHLEPEPVRVGFPSSDVAFLPPRR